MKNLLLFFVIESFLQSCTAFEPTEFEYKVLKLKISTQDERFIGYESTDDGPDITVNSILVNDGKIFFLDRS